jgi:type I restriction enzyme, S subunit
MQIESLATGNQLSMRNISQQAIREIQIPIAPIDKQQRIVAKLNTLMERSARAREELRRVPPLLERLKATYIAQMFNAMIEEGAPITEFGDVINEMRNGLSKKPNDSPPGWPILRISAVRSGHVNINDHKYYDTNEEVNQYFLEDGDLLFIRFNGNPYRVACCGMFNSSGKHMLYPDKLIKVRVNKDYVLPEFVEIIFQSAQVRKNERL